MKKKNVVLICLSVCFVLLAALALGGIHYHRSTYIEINGQTLRRDITEYTLAQDQQPELPLLQQLQQLGQLDCRNVQLTIDEYETLKAGLPGCRILWNVPFQGAYFPEDTAELTVSTLSEADFESLAYLPALDTVHGEACTDYAALLALKEAYPALDIRYNVAVGGIAYPQDTVSLTVENAEAAEVHTALSYLPALEQVTFTGTAPENDTIYRMMCDYPHVDFHWDLTVFGMETPNTATELILSGIEMQDTSQVESYLKYFPDLQRVEMCDCGIGSAEMDALSKRWPNTRFVWTVNIGRGTVRTDITGFIAWKFGYSSRFPLYDKDCTELKYCVDLLALDLGHMKVSDLSFLEYMPKLKYLIVGELPCPDFSPIALCKELIYLEIFNVTFPQQEILLELPNLQDLNMGSTKIYGTEILKQMTWLKRLWIAGTGLTFAEYDELVAALPDTQVVMHIPHSTAGGWRDHQNYRDMRDILGMFYME